MFFVVQVRKSDEKTKIFYKQLLPLELDKIIRLYGNQKTRSMELKALDGTNLEIVCRSYLSEQKIQPTMFIGKEYKPDEFSYYKIRSLTYDSSSKLLDEEFYLYGVDEYEKMFPVDMLTLKGYTIAKNRNFKISEKNYVLFSEFHYENSQQTLIIEKVLTMKFEHNRLSYEINKFGTLETQLKIVAFLIDVFAYMEIECEEFKFKLKKTTKVNKTRDILEGTYFKLNKLKHVFSDFKISLDSNIGDFKDNIPNQMMLLIKTFYDNEYEDLKFPDAITFMDMFFGELRIALLHDPTNEIKMKNAFSQEVAGMRIVASTEEIKESENIESHTPVSIYSLMSSNLMYNAANFDKEVVKQSFDRVNPFINNTSFQITNTFCLECIKAFDRSGRFDFLSVAEYIYQKHCYVSDEDFDSIVIFINKCQIEYRINKELSQQSIKRLMNIKRIYNHYGVLFSVNILLGSIMEANYFLNKMPKKERDCFLNFPIYKIYKELMGEK